MSSPYHSLTTWLRHPGIVWLGIGFAAFLVVAGLRLPGALQAMELAAYDFYLKLRPASGWKEEADEECEEAEQRHPAL